MAVIIPCTSVTRDAFEIGIVQRLSREGTVVPTFPNGDALREWIPQQVPVVMKWGGLAVCGGTLSSWILFGLGLDSWQPILQSILVPVVVASISLLAFFAGEARFERGEGRRKLHTWLSCLWFWLWPSLTFALTYFLVMIGLASYVFRIEQISRLGFVAMASSTGLVMALYSLYLGWRKSYEERLVTIPENIQRCPFVMGMLQQSKVTESVQPLAGVTVPPINVAN